MKTIYWLGYSFFKSAGSAFFNRQVINQDKLAQEGGILICANHESFLDPPFIGILYDENVTYLARKTLFKGIFKWLYRKWDAIPIDQENPDMTGLKMIIKSLKQQKKVVMFPEGERTLTGELSKGLPGVGLIVSKARPVIQPVRISGAYDALPRGSNKLKCSQVDVVVGDPFELTDAQIKEFKGKEGYQRISDLIMERIDAIQRNGSIRESNN